MSARADYATSLKVERDTAQAFAGEQSVPHFPDDGGLFGNDGCVALVVAKTTLPVGWWQPLLRLFTRLALLPQAGIRRFHARLGDEQLCNELAVALTGINRFRHRRHERPVRCARLQHARQIPLLTTEAVELPDDNAVNLLVLDGAKHAFKLWTLGLDAERRDVYIFEHVNDVPAVPFGHCAGVVHLAGGRRLASSLSSLIRA